MWPPGSVANWAFRREAQAVGESALCISGPAGSPAQEHGTFQLSTCFLHVPIAGSNDHSSKARAMNKIVVNKVIVISLGLAVLLGGPAWAQEKVDGNKTQVFVNGVLNVPGAAPDGQTVPSKFSARNAEFDDLSIADLSLRHLTEAQRREIFEQLQGRGSGGLALSPGHAKVGAVLPPDVALRDLKPVPESLTAKVPELRRLSYLADAPNVLLVTSNNVVVGVLSGR
jgi:hypothetical protein